MANHVANRENNLMYYISRIALHLAIFFFSTQGCWYYLSANNIGLLVSTPTNVEVFSFFFKTNILGLVITLQCKLDWCDCLTKAPGAPFFSGPFFSYTASHNVWIIPKLCKGIQITVLQCYVLSLLQWQY